MRKFRSPAAFAEYLALAVTKMPPAIERALERQAEILKKDAKDIIGHYQRDNTGPFPGWAELADSTKEDRVRQGYTANDPLYRNGQLQDSIEASVERRPQQYRLYVGSDSKIAVYQEQGTRTIPPRPFLSLTVWRGREKVSRAAMTAAMRVLAGRLTDD